MNWSRLLPLIGIAVFAAVLLSVDLTGVADSIAGANPLLLFMAASIQAPLVLLKAGKWRMIARASGGEAPFRGFVHAWLVGFVIGIATPGRIGEFTKSLYLRDSMPTGRALASIAVDRIMDISTLFVLAIAGALLFTRAYGGPAGGMVPLMAALLAAFLVASLLVMKRGDFVKGFARPMFRRFVPERHKPGMKSAFHDFYKGLGSIRGAGLRSALPLTLSALAWLLLVFQCSLISMAISLHVGYSFLLAVIPVVVLLDTLPISFSGLGTRELALIFFLGALSVPVAMAVSFSILIFIINYMLLVPFGLVLWLARPVRIGS